MVHLDRITTRTGDDGSTALGDGRRLPKDDILVQALGAVDEANAVFGCLRQVVDGVEADLILALQQELFDLGADLCCPPGSPVGAMVHRLGKAEITAMEDRIAAANAGVAAMTSFVLPGGTAAAAWWHRSSDQQRLPAVPQPPQRSLLHPCPSRQRRGRGALDPGLTAAEDPARHLSAGGRGVGKGVNPIGIGAMVGADPPMAESLPDNELRRSRRSG